MRMPGSCKEMSSPIILTMIVEPECVIFFLDLHHYWCMCVYPSNENSFSTLLYLFLGFP